MPGVDRSFFLSDAVTVAQLLPGMNVVTGPADYPRAVLIRGAEPFSGPCVGIGYAGEPWISKPWRFNIREKVKQ